MSRSYVRSLFSKPRLIGFAIAAAIVFQGAFTRAGQILFVANTATPAAGSSDANIILRLQSQGHTVTAMAAPTTTTASAAGKDLVVVSSTITSADVGAKFANVTAGVVEWEQAILQQSRQNIISEAAARNSDGAFTQITITPAGAAHPLGAGLAAGTYTVTNAASAYSWGDSSGLGTGGVGVGLLGTGTGAEATHLGIIGYSTGALRPDNTPSPGRRATLFLSDNNFNNLTPTGLSLFDASINWTGGFLVPEPSSCVLAACGALGLLAWRRRRSAD
jgi:hypothetical protein